MNICIFGGNSPVGRFGRDFTDRVRKDGHSVYVISHNVAEVYPMPSGLVATELVPYDKNHVFTDFYYTTSVINAFNKVTADVDNLDLILYNSNSGSYPGDVNDFHVDSVFREKSWYDTIRTHAVIPHGVALSALKKMSAGSKFVFMTSNLSYHADRDFCTEEAGYAGGKAAQNQLMLALANHNKQGVIFTAISPYFRYHEIEKYTKVFENVYNHILNLSEKDNGKIKEIFN